MPGRGRHSAKNMLKLAEKVYAAYFNIESPDEAFNAFNGFHLVGPCYGQ
mgnify:CR=1 FL=1